MYIDFHTHGKLAKKLPFSEEYTHWLFSEAQGAGLDALCLTEHFNTWGFGELYQFIASHSEREGDTLVFNGLRIFPGMETDIAEGGTPSAIGAPTKHAFSRTASDLAAAASASASRIRKQEDVGVILRAPRSHRGGRAG